MWFQILGTFQALSAKGITIPFSKYCLSPKSNCAQQKEVFRNSCVFAFLPVCEN